MLKVDLTRLKTDVDRLDIDKLETTPGDLGKLSNVVKNDVVKNIVHEELVGKVNSVLENKILKKRLKMFL